VDVVGADALAERLRAAGLRVTRPRLTVYESLASLGGHRSADEVFDAVRATGSRISRTSAYNALEALRGAGVVLGADAGPGRALYEAATEWHHHAVCRVCGEISDIPCLVGEKPCLDAGTGWGEVDEAQVIFRGVCNRCAAVQ
jgi:Fur family ferric uptake transcriptional regulator